MAIFLIVFIPQQMLYDKCSMSKSMCLPSTFQSALHRGNAFVNQIIIKFLSEKSVVCVVVGEIGSHKRDKKQGDFQPLSIKRATLKSFKVEF